MATFKYHYSASSPPSVTALLNLSHPNRAEEVRDVACLIDTGADITILPSVLIQRLDTRQLDELAVSGYDAKYQALQTFHVRLQVRDLPPVEIETVSSDRISTAILGRDVLNRYRITLDGPNSLMTITDD